MALPTTLPTGPKFASGRPNQPPFISSSGVVYWIGTHRTGTSETISVCRASDPSDSFTVHTSITQAMGTVESMAVAQDGSMLHIVRQSADGVVNYNSFNMGTQQLSSPTSIVGAHTIAAGSACVTIAVRSNGDLVVGYQGTQQATMGTSYDRVSYARRTGSTWTIGGGIGSVGFLTNNYGVGSVIGASDRVHFYFYESISGDFESQSLSSTNVLDTGTVVDGSPAGSWRVAFNGVRLSDGTSIRIAYNDFAGDVSIAKASSAADPVYTFDTAVSQRVGQEAAYLACDIETDTLHLLYAYWSEANRLYRDKNTGSGWGTDVLEFIGNSTITEVASSVYTRQGVKVLAYVVDDFSAAVKYNEYVITPPATTGQERGWGLVPI